jgi:precorrin-2 dehydrogenase/sirohydrochlorin ferrochelatase
MSRFCYPIILNLHGRRCVVVGGGSVAERKVRSLLECGASVTVVSPQVTGALQKLAEGATIGYLPRGYEAGDLQEAFLVIAASDDPEVNTKVWRESSELGILANVADNPEECNFILPSVLRRGGLTLAVGTGGASPALARKLRAGLEGRFGPEYSSLVSLMDSLRTWALSTIENPGRRRGFLLSAAEDDVILERLREGEDPEAILSDLKKSYLSDSDAAGRRSSGENT